MYKAQLRKASQVTCAQNDSKVAINLLIYCMCRSAFDVLILFVIYNGLGVIMIVYELNEVPKKLFEFYAAAFPNSAFSKL